MPLGECIKQKNLFLQLDTFGSESGEVGHLDTKLWSQLPHDLLLKIFARLPFGSLFKILLLSKEWGRNFRSAVFQRKVTADVSSEWETFSPLLCSEGLQMVAFSRRANRWRKLFDLSQFLEDASLAHSSCSWMIIDAAGSLLCLKEFGKPWQRRLIVANPTLRLCKTLPPRRAKTQFLPLFEIVHLLCENSEATGDEFLSRYKVISISQDSSFRDASRAPLVINPGDQREQYGDNHLELTPIRVEIYEPAAGAWMESECGILMLTGLRQLSSVYRDGVVYLLLVSGWQEAYQLFAFNVRTGEWITIPRPMPETASRLAQLVICGSSVLLVLFSAGTEMRSRNSRFCRLFRDGCIARGTISIFRIEEDFRIVLVAEGPDEPIASVDVVEGISGDDECIYLQVFGRPVIVAYNLNDDRWSTLSFLDKDRFPALARELELMRKMSCRYFGSSFNWTSSHFQPGVNPFLLP